MDIDKTDGKILASLQRDGRKTNLDLATEIALSPAACLRRVRALEAAGVITGYAALLSPQALGFAMTVYVDITLSSECAQALDEFERAVQVVEEVLECHLMSGDQDYLLKLAVRDLADYERVHRKVLASLPHVSRVRSSFSIRSVLNHNQLGSSLGQRRVGA